jgi:sec-independent protein translocase protein TatC
MKGLPLKEHFIELKNRLKIVVIFFFTIFLVSYFYSEDIYLTIIKPLADILGDGSHKVIYTGLAEAFLTYIKLSLFTSLLFTLPVIAYQVYMFVAPGLYKEEKIIAGVILFFAPLLFWGGGIFVFYFVIPKAWHFFLSFELHQQNLPLMLEARVSEYLDLVMHLVIAFGFAAEIPIIIMILNLMNILSSDYLAQKRRIAIVINFVIAGIITPPDVLSQVALALPMVFLYEVSIMACRFLEKRNKR